MSPKQAALAIGTPFEVADVSADRVDGHLENTKPRKQERRRTTAGCQQGIIHTRQRERREDEIDAEGCRRERARIVQEMHDTLLQGFLGASMLLHQAVDQTPPDSPSKPTLCRALALVRRALDEGRAALRGYQVAPAPSSLEQAFSNLREAVMPDEGVQFRVFVQGRPRVLKPVTQEQLFLIGREAVMNALRHSKATAIEIEVQYTRRVLRLFVRDDGCGIDPEAVRKTGDSHLGLRGMRERAESIGAEFGIWSRLGAGTKVVVVVSG